MINCGRIIFSETCYKDLMMNTCREVSVTGSCAVKTFYNEAEKLFREKLYSEENSAESVYSVRRFS